MVKILGYTYKVIRDGTIDMIGAAGRFHPKSQTLQIATDQCKEQEISTLLHEIVEALNYHQQWSLEHKTIMSLEASLYQVLVDNGVDLSPLAREIESA